MLTLDIWNESNINNPYRIEDVVKNITVDENLTTNLESSSAIWKVTLPHDCPYSLTIIQKDDLHAKLYDGATIFFTGWVSTNFSYVIDSHGQQAVQITLEDNGTHLLKAPYIKDQSYEISNKFSSIEPDAEGKLGVVQQICNACGIEWINQLDDGSDIMTNDTVVTAVADAGETCESLLKSVCKEMGCVYLFNEKGHLYLKLLSTESLPTGDPIYDNSIYDSIQLTRRARTYRGSRVKWNELGTKTGCLVYRVIEKQDTTHPNCYVEVHTGDTLPDPQGGITYITASDIKEGSEIYSITRVQPSIESSPGNIITTNVFGRKGAKDLQILITANNNGHITKMEATATVKYIKNHNVTYGDANGQSESITENLHEEECRWLHSDEPNSQDPSVLGPVTRYANFLAQYDRYCSSEFQFKTKGTYSLGDIIHLNENLHTGLDAYLMITRRTRVLTSYDETTRTFGGIWTYTAVSTKAFNYNKTTSKESTSIPPSTSYTETQPDVSNITTLQLRANRSFLKKDYRSYNTQTVTINVDLTGPVSGITVTASYSNGTPITVTTVTADQEWTITVPENTNTISVSPEIQSVNITATVNGNVMNVMSLSYNDQTQYYKLLGNYSSDPTESQAGIILVGDFYLNTTNGKTYECTARTGSTLTWGEMLLSSSDPARSARNATKYLMALESASLAGVDLSTMSNPNTVSWFNLIIASKAVIDNLFSQYITILDTGSIHSSAYSDVGAKVNANPGFWLGANGQLLCDSGHMTNLSISGNSVFGGDFDCDVIKTADGSVTVRGTAQATDISKYQSRQLARDIRSLSLGGGLQPARIQNASGSYQQAVAYVSFLIDEGSHNTEYKVSFFDSAGSQINVTNMFSCTTNRESGPSIHYRKGKGISPPEYYTYSNVSFTIEFIQGANRTLQLTLPNGPSGLASGMVYRNGNTLMIV